ncbi:unnamed protein product [Musa acuminata subsp. malaccensis]|uniref:(wild Malaysian banana) hypothetical protein n=1 Tax=Musa acuminata subsp. malaccensis TaxID=214687 RepID=A0A804KHV2_MUSAM|nr:unnamed protein product [Musa acuminata subsp. malaccensis]
MNSAWKDLMVLRSCLSSQTGPYVESSETTEGSPPCQAWSQAMKTQVHSPSQL